MKILLINPPQYSAYGKGLDIPAFFPIGLGYIGAVLEENGYDVDLIDVDNQKISDDHIAEKLKNGNYGLVGITATSPTIGSAFKLAHFIKSKVDTRIVLGGVHPTIFPEHSFESPDIDFTIRGEGEDSILELVRALDKGGDFKKILGLSFRGDNKVFHNQPRTLIMDLDRIPFPMTHRLNTSHYTFANALMKRIAPMITSRGCPGRCTYCCTQKMFGTKMRYRSANNVLREMLYLKDEFDIQELHMWDDNFISNKNFVIELRNLMKERKLTFKISLMNGVRVDYFSEEIAGYLKDMGVYSVGFGFESGNQKILNGVRKGIKLETSMKAIRIAKQFGFETWGFFMLGLIGDDEKSINETIKFALKLDPDIAKFHILKPFPGTEVYEQLKRSGLLLSEDFDRYSIHSEPVHKLPALTGDDLMALQRKAYRTFYFRPKMIFKQILNLKTFERAKANAKAAMNIFNMTKGRS